MEFHGYIPRTYLASSHSCHATSHGDHPSPEARLTHSSTSHVSPGHGSTTPVPPGRTGRSPPRLESHHTEPPGPAPILGKHHNTAVRLVRHQVRQASSEAPGGGDHRDHSSGVAAESEAGRPQLHGVAYSHEYPTTQQSDKGSLSTRFRIVLAKPAAPNAPGE